MNQAQAMQAEKSGERRLESQDRQQDPNYVVYVYNLLDREYLIQQPPLFPGFHIPAREPGKKFSVTLLPAFVNEVYFRPGTDEYYYKPLDGRKAASTLLNPGAFPGIRWEGQLHAWKTDDQFGNNLNKFGVFWSLTPPTDSVKLDAEMKLFKDRLEITMRELVKAGEAFHANGELKNITPLHHYAMDYLGQQAPWHMSMHHMIACPNCGESVRDGIAYHKNAFGEKCIIDQERYLRSVVIDRPRKAAPAIEEEEEQVQEVAPPQAAAKPAKKKAKAKAAV